MSGSLDEANLIIQDDPFYQYQIADYDLTLFTPTKYAPQIRELMAIADDKTR